MLCCIGGNFAGSSFPPTGEYTMRNADGSKSVVNFTRLDAGYTLKQTTTEKDGSITFLKIAASPTSVSTSSAIHPCHYKFEKKSSTDGGPTFFTANGKRILMLNNVTVESIDRWQALSYVNNTVSVHNGLTANNLSYFYVYDGIILYCFKWSKHNTLIGPGTMYLSAPVALYSTDASFNSRLREMVSSTSVLAVSTVSVPQPSPTSVTHQSSLHFPSPQSFPAPTGIEKSAPTGIEKSASLSWPISTTHSPQVKSEASGFAPTTATKVPLQPSPSVSPLPHAPSAPSLIDVKEITPSNSTELDPTEVNSPPTTDNVLLNNTTLNELELPTPASSAPVPEATDPSHRDSTTGARTGDGSTQQSSTKDSSKTRTAVKSHRHSHSRKSHQKSRH